MDIRIGDVLEMKKPHPCGCKQFLVTRAGMDFKIQCQKCGHLIIYFLHFCVRCHFSDLCFC